MVEQKFKDWLIDTGAGTPYILKEAAILFESGSYKSLDRTINVYAPLKLRIERTLLRDRHRTLSEIEQIIRNQMNEEERSRLVDHIIVNDDCTPLLPQVEAIDKLLRDAVH
jgi:dephospho-CoA kinase